MSDIAHIQWFPGHMTKARRTIEADLKLVDAVAEIVDARIPESSRNPVLNEIVARKPRIVIMNKCDYADNAVTSQWISFYKNSDVAALACDCRSGKGVNKFVPLLKSTLSELLERRRERGMIGKPLRVMIVGIPNVGKSSFINRIAKAKKTNTADKPGVTRGRQWVTIDKEIELLDTPGVLWPKFDDQEAAQRLAFTGAIKDDIMDIEALAAKLVAFLAESYPERLAERFKLDSAEQVSLALIAKSRGMLISGGEADTLRAATAVIDEFRGGKFGRISFEKP